MKKRIVVLALIGGMGLSMTACEEGVSGAVQAGGQEQNDSSDLSADISFEALDTNLDEMERLLEEARNELTNISLADILAERVDSSGASDKAEKALRKVFDGLLSVMDRVDAKIAELRAKIDERMLKLDPLNPLHIQLAMKLHEMSGYLDQLEGELDEVLARLVQSLDKKVAEVDEKVANLDMSKPVSWVAILYWKKLRAVIVEYRGKIEAKI